MRKPRHESAGEHFGKAVLRPVRSPVFRKTRANLKAGPSVGAEIFTVGQEVDVLGPTSRSRFSGVIRRHNFSRTAHRTVTWCINAVVPSVWRRIRAACSGKRMAGHGNAQRTVQALKLRGLTARGLLMIKPGARYGWRHVRQGRRQGEAK